MERDGQILRTTRFRRRALQMKDGWKHEDIFRFENHVSNLTKVHPSQHQEYLRIM